MVIDCLFEIIIFSGLLFLYGGLVWKLITDYLKCKQEKLSTDFLRKLES
jgi:hypothetical protein